jgi:hypothetical protein
VIEALLPSRGGRPSLRPLRPVTGSTWGWLAPGAMPPVKSGLFVRHAGVIACVREALILRWGVSARVASGGARAAGVAQGDTLAAPAATRSAMRTGEGIVTREDERKGRELRRSCATWPPVVQDGLARPARCALCEPAGPCRTGLLGWLRG